MKILNILFILFFISNSFSQSLFEKTDLVDEFGDKISEFQRNVSFGVFSNSATNNSELRVHTILNIQQSVTLKEFEDSMIKALKDIGESDKSIKQVLKYSEETYKYQDNIKGFINFGLYEYENNLPSIIGIKSGSITIKTSDGKKIQAPLRETSFIKNSVYISAYKELTEGLSGVKSQIEFGYYDWRETEIYDSIVNATEPIMVVITFGNSTYKFTLKHP